MQILVLGRSIVVMIVVEEPQITKTNDFESYWLLKQSNVIYSLPNRYLAL